MGSFVIPATAQIDRRRSAFTLIEVLIVVVIVAILAATILPRFSDSTQEAKLSALKSNIHLLRTYAEAYRMYHSDSYPAIIDNDLPQLTSATNASGTIGPAGPDFPYGPYISQQLPLNPFDGSRKVTAVAKAGEKPTGVVGTLGGWQYDASNGFVWPNNPEYYQASP